MSKKATAEVVDAQVVETRLVVTGTPGSAIEANFDAIRARIASIVELYEGTVVTPAYLTGAKRDRAYLNGLDKEIAQRRIEIKKTYMAPVVAFEAKVAELVAPIKNASDAIDAQVKAIEEQERVEKRVALVAHWEEFAGVLADAVPFEQVTQDAWLLKSTPLAKGYEAIEILVERVAREDATLSDLCLSHPGQAKARYLATLDMSAAIAYSKELDAQEERARRLEAEKAEIAAENATAHGISVAEAADAVEAASAPPVVVEEPAAEPDEEVITWLVRVTCTRTQRDTFLAYLTAAGLHGNVSSRPPAGVPTRPVFCIACKTRIEDGVAADVTDAEIATMTCTACNGHGGMRAAR